MQINQLSNVAVAYKKSDRPERMASKRALMATSLNDEEMFDCEGFEVSTNNSSIFI